MASTPEHEAAPLRPAQSDKEWPASGGSRLTSQGSAHRDCGRRWTTNPKDSRVGAGSVAKLTSCLNILIIKLNQRR